MGVFRTGLISRRSLRETPIPFLLSFPYVCFVPSLSWYRYSYIYDDDMHYHYDIISLRINIRIDSRIVCHNESGLRIEFENGERGVAKVRKRVLFSHFNI
jgi:hypothetical protein